VAQPRSKLPSDRRISINAAPVFRTGRHATQEIAREDNDGTLHEVSAEIHYLRTKETGRESEITEQKRTIKELSEKLASQEKVLQRISGQTVKLGKAELKTVTDEIMLKLEKDLHLERQRRGLF